MSTVLAVVGAVLLCVTACYHLTGLRSISSGLEGERLGLTKAAWICVAIDWILIAAAWLAAAAGFAPVALLSFGAALPVAGAVVLAFTLGLKFPGVWLLALASVCGFLASTNVMP